MIVGQQVPNGELEGRRAVAVAQGCCGVIVVEIRDLCTVGEGMRRKRCRIRAVDLVRLAVVDIVKEVHAKRAEAWAGRGPRTPSSHGGNLAAILSGVDIIGSVCGTAIYAEIDVDSLYIAS